MHKILQFFSAKLQDTRQPQSFVLFYNTFMNKSIEKIAISE